MHELGKVEGGGEIKGSFLGRSTAAALLLVIGGSLAGCGGTGANEANEEGVGNVASALTYDATKVGCPNSGYVAIKSWYGYYCRPDGSNMTCYSTTLAQEGYFRIVDNYDGTIAIRARDGANLSWQNYVGATAGGGFGLYHTDTNPTDYDARFQPVADNAGHYSFRTYGTGNFVTAQNGGGSFMRGDGVGIGYFEKFTVECY